MGVLRVIVVYLFVLVVVVAGNIPCLDRKFRSTSTEDEGRFTGLSFSSTCHCSEHSHSWAKELLKKTPHAYVALFWRSNRVTFFCAPAQVIERRVAVLWWLIIASALLRACLHWRRWARNSRFLGRLLEESASFAL